MTRIDLNWSLWEDGHDANASFRGGACWRAVAAAAGLLAVPRQVLAQAPAADAVTPALIEAAKKEGKRRLVRGDGPAGVAARRQAGSRRNIRASRCGSSAPARSGSSSAWRRNTARKIYAADIINASDAAHFVAWKRNGWLAPYVPEDVAKFFPAEHRDADGLFATVAHLCGLARLQHQPW